MPTWHPRWDDVAFDHAAAAEAAAECDAMARTLREASAERERLADHARDGWRGPARDAFDRAMADLGSRSAAAEAGLRALAATIRQAAVDATRDQAARVAERTRWHAEAIAEQHAAPPRAS